MEKKESPSENHDPKPCSNIISVKEYYEYVAHQINREDGLVNSRLTWMLTFQGFLFASLALIGEREKVGQELYCALIYVLPFLGATIALLSYLSVEGALSAIKSLKNDWINKEEDLDIAGVFPRPFGQKVPHTLAAIFIRLLPFSVTFAWIYLFLELSV